MFCLARIVCGLALILVGPALAVTEDYDPYADAVLTCEEMTTYPELSFGPGWSPDLGSGHRSPIDVEYDCPSGLGALPYMQRLLALTEEIRGEPSAECSGSLMFAHWRYWSFNLLEAGIAPRNLPHRQAERLRFDPFYYAELPVYFESWSYQGLHNFRLYRDFQRESRKIEPRLARHYRDLLKTDREEARMLASLALVMFSKRAAGTVPAGEVLSSYNTLMIAGKVKGPLRTLRAWIALQPNETRLEALRIALLTRQPWAKIALLSENVDLEHGDEPALFFALEDRRNTRFLLQRGVDVNHANGFGKTALFYAIGMNDAALARDLLAAGAEVNQTYVSGFDDSHRCDYAIEHMGRTTLMHAAQHADARMMRLLIAHGVDVKRLDGDGETAIDYALRAKKLDNVAFLRHQGLAPRH